MRTTLRSTALALIAALPLAALAQAQPAQPNTQLATSTPEIAFMRADSNGDGKLTQAEAARLPQVSPKFDALDKDKDGVLSMQEYMVAFEAPRQ